MIFSMVALSMMIVKKKMSRSCIVHYYRFKSGIKMKTVGVLVSGSSRQRKRVPVSDMFLVKPGMPCDSLLPMTHQKSLHGWPQRIFNNALKKSSL